MVLTRSVVSPGLYSLSHPCTHSTSMCCPSIPPLHLHGHFPSPRQSAFSPSTGAATAPEAALLPTTSSPGQLTHTPHNSQQGHQLSSPGPVCLWSPVSCPCSSLPARPIPTSTPLELLSQCYALSYLLALHTLFPLPRTFPLSFTWLALHISHLIFVDLWNVQSTVLSAGGPVETR